MPASIIFKQGTKIGQPGHTLVVDLNVPVVCTNAQMASLYLWTLLDSPIRSTVTRKLTSEAASFTFTPDVAGTYLVSLRVNDSTAPTENATSFVAVLTAGEDRMGWRYCAAGETNEDTATSHDLDGGSLGFPNDINPRGWASQEDIEREQIERTVRRVSDATVTPILPGQTRLVSVDPATGRLDPTLLPTVLFTQSVPAATWLIDHNLGKYPAIVITDSAGNEVRGDVQHLSVNRVKLTFNGAFSGTATCC